MTMRFISTAIFFVFAFTINAQNYGQKISDSTAFLERLKSVNASTQTIESDFTMTKRVAIMSDLQKSFGRFYFKREGAKICLDYTEPKGNKVIISDEDFIIVTGGKASKMNATQNPAIAQMKNMIWACMTGDFMPLGERSETTYYENNEDFTIVILPANRRVKRYMSEIVLQFSKSDMTMSTMKITEANGDYSHYEYTNKRVNIVVDDNKFQP